MITEEAFVERYRPLPNALDDNASFDFGDGGCLYETFGAEFEYIHAQSSGHVWTIVETDGALAIVSGFHYVNRMGYILTARPCAANTNVIVECEDLSDDEGRLS